MSLLSLMLWLLLLLVAGSWWWGRQGRLPALFSGHEPAWLARLRRALSPPGQPARQEGDEVRLPVTVLLLGGAALVVMGQETASTLLPPRRAYALVLVAAGALLFLVGGQSARQGRLPGWLHLPASLLGRYFALNNGQLMLLLLAPLLALLARLAAGDGLHTAQGGITWVAWLLAMGAAVAGSLKGEQMASAPRLSRRDLVLSLGLFVAAFALRGTLTGQFPTTFSGDEGSAGLTAVTFHSGQSNNPLTVGWFSFPSFFYAVQSAGIALFGQTIEGVRLPSAIIGSFTVVALYWLARVLFDQTTALLAAAYLLASHYHIHFSRIALNNAFDPFFAVLALAGLWHGWHRGRRSSFILAGVALGLGQYFYVAIRGLPLLVLLWLLAAFIWQRQRFKSRLPDLLLAAFAGLIIALPLLLFFARHPDEFAAPLNRVTILHGWLEQEMRITGLSAAAIVRGQMGRAALGFVYLPLRLLYDPGVPLLLPAAGGLFVLGLLLALWELDLCRLLLLLPLVSVVFMSGFSQDPPASQRYIMAIPMVAIVLALPLARLWHWLSHYWPRYRSLVGAALALFMLWLMWADVHFYFVDVYRQYVLGGVNTEAATEMARFLQQRPDPPVTVYFFGAPRMGYKSLSTIPYLNPGLTGVDVEQPLREVPTWPLQGYTVFLFLPERAGEAELVRQAFPQGRYQERHRGNGDPLFMAYEVGR